MAKAIVAPDPWLVGMTGVAIDGTEVGWVTRGSRRAWIDGAEKHLAGSPASGDLEADVRWILEQIPGCADLEIEWVNE